MSSMVRRLEIRGMKARGFARTPYAIRKNALGQWEPVRVPRGGLILGPEPECQAIGYHWPRTVDLRKAAVA